MIHYHGTPVSGGKLNSVDFLSGRHALIPFAYPQDLPVVAEICQSFILDNSAYTYWRQGGELDIGNYFGWVTSWAQHPALDWCLIPDVIDGDEQQNIGLVNIWLRSGIKCKGVPVYHLHESFGWLEYLIDNFETIALGSSGDFDTPDTPKWWKRINEIMKILCDKDGKPKRKIHGLRMLSPHIIDRLPLSSADSANAVRNGGDIKRFGMYAPPNAGQRSAIIATRIEAVNSPAIWTPLAQQELQL